MPEKKPTRTADLDYFYGQSSELFSFYRIPKLLFQDSRFQPLSTDAKTLYGILLDRMSLSARNGWLDKAGRVFIIYTVQEVQDSLGCADKKATKLLRELEEYGLIERKRRGLGKPDLIYVKNFSSESSKLRFLNRDNDDSGVVQNTLQDPAKLRCNKTKENDTEMSETDSFYSEEADGMSKRTQLEEYFLQSLEVDLLLRLCPDDEDPSIWSRARLPIPLAGRRSRTILHPAKRWALLEKRWTVRNCTGNRQQPRRSAGNSAEPTGRARRQRAAHPPDCSFPKLTGRRRSCKGPSTARSGRWSRKIPASSRATWGNAVLRRLWATETAVSRTGGRNAS